MRTIRLALLALSLLGAGCYNPATQPGSVMCSLDGKCPEGLMCFPDKHCYKPGANPTCLPVCGGQTLPAIPSFRSWKKPQGKALEVARARARATKAGKR